MHIQVVYSALYITVISVCSYAKLIWTHVKMEAFVS